MLGLFGTLSMGSRSLQNQQQAIEVAGHNLANVNNPAYARQRLTVQTAATIQTEQGLQGTGANAVAITRLRSALVDQQVTSESSVSGSLEAQQEALQNAQAELGQVIDRQASGAEGAAAAQGVGGQHGIAEGLDDLFNSFQSLSTNPTSLAERQVLLMKAGDLATKFNLTDKRLADLKSSLNDSLDADVAHVNLLLKDIAKFNDQITRAELSSGGVANDMRDTRQAKIEELAKLVKIDTADGSAGAINISVGGVTLVDRNQLVDTLQTFDAGGGQMLIRTQTSATPVTVAGGRLQGTIDVRDGTVASLQANLNTLASQLISKVNTVHAGGFSLTGSTGENFFSGSTAASIKVNTAISGNPALIQAGGVAGAVGDNQVALALAQLSTATHASLNNQTFSESYSQSVASLGQSLSSVNAQMSDQEVVSDMLQRQRDSLSGVSLDEEMTDMVKFQKAFQASAKLITTVDEMLDTIIGMKR